MAWDLGYLKKYILIKAHDGWLTGWVVFLVPVSWLECDGDNKFGLYQIAGYETTQTQDPDTLPLLPSDTTSQLSSPLIIILSPLVFRSNSSVGVMNILD